MANTELTEFLIKQGVLQDDTLISAFNNVDRQDFLPQSQKHRFLENNPIPIGHGQTNSQPFTVAFMLELLLPRPGENILDVGIGSGWTTALIASIICESKGKVTGVELIPELVEFSASNLGKYDFSCVEIKQAESIYGWPKNGPYDKILVSAGADETPQELIDQLKIGGRMVIPVKQSILAIEKADSGLKTHEFPGFVFVPLIQSNE